MLRSCCFWKPLANVRGILWWVGAFVAVPLFRVNEYALGPHPAGSYESKSSFANFVSSKGALDNVVASGDCVPANINACNY